MSTIRQLLDQLLEQHLEQLSKSDDTDDTDDGHYEYSTMYEYKDKIIEEYGEYSGPIRQEIYYRYKSLAKDYDIDEEIHSTYKYGGKVNLYIDWILQEAIPRSEKMKEILELIRSYKDNHKNENEGK